MTRVVFYRCSDRAEHLPLYRPSLTNWTIPSVYMERYVSKLYVRTLAKVKYVIYWAMNPMSDSSQATAKNRASLLKKGIIARLQRQMELQQLLHFK